MAMAQGNTSFDNRESGTCRNKSQHSYARWEEQTGVLAREVLEPFEECLYHIMRGAGANSQEINLNHARTGVAPFSEIVQISGGYDPSSATPHGDVMSPALLITLRDCWADFKMRRYTRLLGSYCG